MNNIIYIDSVEADKITGEWLSDPEFTGDTSTIFLWNRKEDTENIHYDVYMDGGQTRGIIVVSI